MLETLSAVKCYVSFLYVVSWAMLVGFLLETLRVVKQEQCSGLPSMLETWSAVK